MLFVFSLLMGSTTFFAQAREELNFGLIGASYEIPVHTDITVAPTVGTSIYLDWFVIGLKGNYYFDNVFNVRHKYWDIYGGISTAYASRIDEKSSSNDELEDKIDLGFQVGLRWFWSDQWGVYLEIGRGSVQGPTGGLGLTVRLD